MVWSPFFKKNLFLCSSSTSCYVEDHYEGGGGNRQKNLCGRIRATRKRVSGAPSDQRFELPTAKVNYRKNTFSSSFVLRALLSESVPPPLRLHWLLFPARLFFLYSLGRQWPVNNLLPHNNNSRWGGALPFTKEKVQNFDFIFFFKEKKREAIGDCWLSRNCCNLWKNWAVIVIYLFLKLLKRKMVKVDVNDTKWAASIDIPLRNSLSSHWRWWLRPSVLVHFVSYLRVARWPIGANNNNKKSTGKA